MKLIYLLRHGKSSWDDPTLSDFDRPLTRRGIKAALLIADYFRQAEIVPAALLCSPAKRAVETFELLGFEGSLATFDDRLYEASGQTLLTRLKELPNDRSSVLLIGHNPGLQSLALSLARAKPGAWAWDHLAVKLPTSALASLSAPIDDWRDLGVGRCSLDSLTRPRDLGDEKLC